MLFSKLAEYLEKLEKTASRLEITAILTDLFKKTSSDEIQKTVYLTLGVLAPNYEGIILNLAEKMVLRAIALAYSKDIDSVTKLYKVKGDVGDTAQELHRPQLFYLLDNSHRQEYQLPLLHQVLRDLLLFVHQTLLS